MSTLYIAELYGGYSWKLVKELYLEAGIGVAKVFSTSVTLETGLPVFQASKAGESLLISTQNQLSGIINTYGIAPTALVSFSYYF